MPRPPSFEPGPEPPWALGWAPDTSEVLAVASAPVPALPAFPDARQSAVLVVVSDAGGGPEVLLTRRAWNLRTHRGEISFPGGALDPGERHDEAALREAWEEVGLEPAAVTVHGELEHLNTVVSRHFIVPYLASVEGRPELAPRTPEAERVMWVPLAELTEPGVYWSERWGEPPFDRLLHFFGLDDETVWGATGRILFDLLTRALGPAGSRA